MPGELKINEFYQNAASFVPADLKPAPHGQPPHTRYFPGPNGGSSGGSSGVVERVGELPMVTS